MENIDSRNRKADILFIILIRLFYWYLNPFSDWQIN